MFDAMRADLAERLAQMRTDGVYKPEHVIAGRQGANVALADGSKEIGRAHV